MTGEQIKHMVTRFLSWRLPENFHPDGGISFAPEFNVEYMASLGKPPMRHDPVGTNLLDYEQASAMVRHMLEELPAASAQVRVVCKGAWELSSACGRCARCLETAPAEIERLKRLVRTAEADADMYAKAWQRELGPWMAPKSHHIDACAQGTQNLMDTVNELKPWAHGLRRWRADSLTARTLGVPDPDLAEYLPRSDALK